MTAWTLSTDDSTITFDDGAGHRYVIARCDGGLTAPCGEGVDHFHATESFPWALDGAERASPEDVCDWYRTLLENNGHTVTEV